MVACAKPSTGLFSPQGMFYRLVMNSVIVQMVQSVPLRAAGLAKHKAWGSSYLASLAEIHHRALRQAFASLHDYGTQLPHGAHIKHTCPDPTPRHRLCDVDHDFNRNILSTSSFRYSNFPSSVLIQFYLFHPSGEDTPKLRTLPHFILRRNV